MNDFTLKLNNLLDDRAMTGYELHKLTNISMTYIYKMIRGEMSNPSVKIISLMAYYLEVDANYFL